MSNEGVVYVAIGEAAERACSISRAGLDGRNDYPVTVIRKTAPGLSDTQSSRAAKTALYDLSIYEHTCYLDADTLPLASIRAGFEILADGWELVITASPNQGRDSLWHVAEPERTATLDGLGYPALQLQAGVFWFRRSAAVARLFKAWRAEWERWRGQDQAALLRALALAPVKVWILGRDWNGGAVIAHRWGAIRRAA